MLRNSYFKFNYKNLFVVKMILFVYYFYSSAEFRVVDRVYYFSGVSYWRYSFDLLLQIEFRKSDTLEVFI